mmetsp:Transcript_11011/g.28416  ORF Transcript_11011/g.28416 Transcript_11011/m.28416 type:complete len:109 (-) Transcript_11011:148-474(-)
MRGHSWGQLCQFVPPDQADVVHGRMRFRTRWSDKGLSFDFNQLIAPGTIEAMEHAMKATKPEPPPKPGPKAAVRWNQVRAASRESHKARNSKVSLFAQPGAAVTGGGS